MITNQGQGFGFFTYNLSPSTDLNLITSFAASDNQLPNQPNLTSQFALTGVNYYPSADINSYLNFLDYLGIAATDGSLAPNLTYQIAYAAHYISQDFQPDNIGELLYHGVASIAFHSDLDNTLEGDLAYKTGAHTLAAGFYLGEYGVEADDNSLVFKVDQADAQIGPPFLPIRDVNNGPSYTLSLAALYSSGLRGGFADLESLPYVVQVDLSGQKAIRIPHLGEVTERITLLNRTNLIRPAEDIGIFQAAYGPRITVYDTVTVPLPAITL